MEFIKNARFTDDFTDEQLAFFSEFDAFLKDKSRHIFILQGYAGSGKTYLISVLHQYLKSINHSVVICSPTGRAVNVLNQRLQFSEAATIHRQIYELQKIWEFKRDDEKSQALELQNPRNKSDKEVEHKIIFNVKNNPHSSDCVYIFDESSMISDDFSDDEHLLFGSGSLLSDILKFINLNNKEYDKKILFVGDNAQLPPVKTNESPALSSEYLGKKTGLHITQSILQKVVRQKNSILDTASALRRRLENDNFGNVYIECNGDDLCEISYHNFLGHYLQSYKKLGAGQIQVIAHTNKSCCEFNKDIRLYLGKNKPLEICDRLVVTKNCYLEDNIIANGEFLTLIDIMGDIERKTLPLYDKDKKNVELSFVSVKVADSAGKMYIAKIIYSYFENLMQDRQMPSEIDISKALYIDFKKRFDEQFDERIKEQKDTFIKQGYQNEIMIDKYTKSGMFKRALLADGYFNALRVAFGYAVTCHKAQGGEWSEVFIDCNAKMDKKSKEYIRWLYTAITRAKDKVYLLNPPKKRTPLPF